MYLISDRRR